ncbi:dymeclin-like [Diadema antillarum]|uniref:dymeclin-like n=1 Tax=Diadema antillarum TaxID=105358 RepID=UPI003A89B63E
MGGAGSSLSELAENEFLRRFVGKEPIDDSDPFWEQLLSFSFKIPQSTADARLIVESSQMLCKTLSHNNLHSGNLCALVRVFIKRALQLKVSAQNEDHVFTWQTYNALFIIRRSLKYFLEMLSEGRILQQLSVVVRTRPAATVLDLDLDGPGMENGEAGADGEGEETLLERFIQTLVQLLVEVPVLNFTYVIHLEAMNTLLVLLSVQMYIPRISHKSLVTEYIMHGKCASDAHILVKILLDQFIKREECPLELLKDSAKPASFLYGISAAIAAGIWAVLTLGYGGMGAKKEEPADRAILANQSLLLLLVLTNHYTHDRGVHNPYRLALCSFANSQDGGMPMSPSGTLPPFKLNSANLYETFCDNLRDDQSTLLLYLLLHQNANFRNYVLSRTNIDRLVMPLLKILYNAQERNSHHIYMTLIILLILSEDDAFNKCVHELDKYLHTNCLAALANILFELLIKKHDKIVEQLRLLSAVEPNGDIAQGGELEHDDLLSDLSVLEEVIRMVLEIINSCLTNMLPHNPHLVYTLLYKQELFASFKAHPKFQDIIQNIDTVLTYFSVRLEESQDEQYSPSVHQVLDIIKQGMLQWPRDRLRKFPELKFKYVEEDQPEEFFIPYVWSLVYHSSNMYWDPDRVELFSINAT